MNNLSNERLKDIANLKSTGNMIFPASHEESAAMACELLAYREAAGRPVAWLITPKRIAKPFTTNSKATALRNERMGKSIAPLYEAPQLPSAPQLLLRELVDVVWQDAKESTEVPATSHADELIAKAFGKMAPFREIAETSTKHFREISETSTNSLVIPDGLALVPIEPTEGMVIDGFESEPDETFSEANVWETYQAMSGCEQAAHRALLCWRAMLAAAPRPPATK